MGVHNVLLVQFSPCLPNGPLRFQGKCRNNIQEE